ERRTSYYNSIALADRDWWAGSVSHAEEVLEDCPSGLRHWEWRYLKRRCHTDIFTLQMGSAVIPHVAFSPDGKYVATRDIDGVILWDVKTKRKTLLPQKCQKLGDNGDIGAGGQVEFSHDGKRLMAFRIPIGFGGPIPGAVPSALTVWDVATNGKAIQVMKGNP